MKEKLYSEWEQILRDSEYAYSYAEAHFDELMARPVAHVLYGPDSYGMGAGQPSQRMVPYKERILRDKTRRKRFWAYYLDSNWNLLYCREMVETNRIMSTVINFWIDDTNYARWFFEDRNAFYMSEVFSVQYQSGTPVRFAMACRDCRVYVEYLQSISGDQDEPLTICNWFDYYPTRTVDRDGTVLSKDAPFGAKNSPVKMGKEVFRTIDMDFSHWNNGSYPWYKAE